MILRTEIVISDEAFELLKDMEKLRGIEYRDSQYETTEEFLNSTLYKDNGKTLEWFHERNHNGTYHLIGELETANLVDMDDMSWHPTYELTDFGKKVLDENK